MLAPLAEATATDWLPFAATDAVALAPLAAATALAPLAAATALAPLAAALASIPQSKSHATYTNA